MQEHIIGENKIYVVENEPNKEMGEIFRYPLVLVHGSWGGHWMWKMYDEFFTKSGFKTYTLDLRGHGKSGGELAGATMDSYASDVDAVVKELGIENPVIVGHSMGGLVTLMYSAINRSVKGMVSINGSPSKEAQGESKDVKYPEVYSPVDAGMPTDPMEAMRVFPDIPQEMLMKMKEMLGMESGLARSQRKKGVSVPKESLNTPMLFVGTEKANSVPFGVGIQKSKAMAEYYGGEFVEIKGATHPGILMGKEWQKGAEAVANWVKKL